MSKTTNTLTEIPNWSYVVIPEIRRTAMKCFNVEFNIGSGVVVLDGMGNNHILQGSLGCMPVDGRTFQWMMNEDRKEAFFKGLDGGGQISEATEEGPVEG